MALFYFFSDRVRRNIWYGRQARNLLDLYVPYRHWLQSGKVPVVVFVTGGAWTIGYKAWGALLARRLSQRGIMVACLDYRNFPQVHHCPHAACNWLRFAAFMHNTSWSPTLRPAPAINAADLMDFTCRACTSTLMDCNAGVRG